MRIHPAGKKHSSTIVKLISVWHSRFITEWRLWNVATATYAEGQVFLELDGVCWLDDREIAQRDAGRCMFGLIVLRGVLFISISPFVNFSRTSAGLLYRR